MMNSLSKEYFKFTIVAFGFLIFSCFFSGYFIYEKFQENHVMKLEKNSHEIQKIIGENFHEIEQLMKYIGKEISKESVDDFVKIAQHLQLVKASGSYICSWTLFDWVNTQNQLVASSVPGVIFPHVQIYGRSYLIEGPKRPWQLISCPPDWGLSSGAWIVPIGMGITNENGQFMGILTGGINIHAVTQKIQQNLSLSNIDFIVLDENKNPVFHSFTQESSQLKVLGPVLFREFDCLYKEKTFHQNPIEALDIYFHGYEKVQGHSYYLFTGINQNLVKNEFYAAFFPVILELGGFSLFCLILIYIFWKKRIQPVETLALIAAEVSQGNTEIKVPIQTCFELNQFERLLKQITFYIQERQKHLFQLEEAHQQLKYAYNELNCKNKELQDSRSKQEQIIDLFRNSDIEKEKFLQQINKELGHFLIEISDSADILQKNLKGQFDFFLSSEMQMGVIEKIIEGTKSLEILASNQIFLQEIDISQVIQESILILSKTAFLKNIAISFQANETLPKIFLDRLRLQQVVVGILSRALQYMPDAGCIELKVMKIDLNQNEMICVSIKDSGFGLDETEIYRLEEKFFNRSTKFFDVISPELSVIKKLVELLEGSIQVDTKWRDSTTILVFFPYHLEKKSLYLVQPSSNEQFLSSQIQ